MEQKNITIFDEFQKLNKRLDDIERGGLAQKTVLNFEEFCNYTGISKSWGYKLTHRREVPHYSPNNKTLYFDRSQIDLWLLQNPIKTKKQLEKEVLGGQRR